MKSAKRTLLVTSLMLTPVSARQDAAFEGCYNATATIGTPQRYWPVFAAKTHS